MEQYWMPKKLDFKNLRFCIDNYPADFIYIRLIGSKGGTIKINESLNDKKLDFKKDKSGLYLFIDSQEIFHFPLKDYQKGFALAYYRGNCELNHGVNPYDSHFPEPKKSILRNVLDDHLLEIFFKGRVNLKFHSWWKKPHWKYWTCAR